MTTRFGFKKLTPANWLQPDTPSTIWTRREPDGTMHPVEGDDWVRSILKPQLTETVPDEVQRLFEVARSALAYGYFFYPLYTLGTDQLHRVAEAAVTHKCRAIGAPSKIRTFEKKVQYLMDLHFIPKSEETRWNGIRGSRNESSHADHQSIMPPTVAIRTVKIIADQINALFPS